MKVIFTTILILTSLGVSSQTIEVDSKEYQELKKSNQLDGKILQLTEDMFVPSKTFKPRPQNTNGKSSGCECYVEPDATYTLAMAPNDDGSSALINIPFNFCFYGQTYNSFYINNNGNITFDNPMATFSATAFPSVGPKIIAPFWGDVDTGGGNGTVVYKITPTAVYINWEDVGYYSQQGDKLNTFQMIITDGADPVVSSGNVAFCYQDMQWTTGAASGGVNGFGGTPATAGANKGDGAAYFLISRFDHAGTDFDGALGNPDGISWLDDKSFFFDVCNTTNIPPIPEGISLCDTFRICSYGDTADFSINFLSPEVNQTTSITFNNGGLASLTEVSNTPGNTAQLVLRAEGTPLNAGTYNISVTATDDFVPPGITTINFVLVIDSTLTAPDPIMDPLVGCDSLEVGLLNGPFETYLWDNFSTDTSVVVNSSQSVGVTVSLNGCYKRIEEDVIIETSPQFNLPSPLAACGNEGMYLELSDSLNMGSVSWGLADPGLDSLYSNTLTDGTYTLTAFSQSGACQNDTTFTIDLYALPSIFNDTMACNYTYIVTNTSSEGGGTWSSLDTAISFLPDNFAENPTITTSTPGTYTLTYTDNVCNQELTADIYYPSYVWAYLEDTVVCEGTEFTLFSGQHESVTDWLWSTGSTDETIIATEPGLYELTVSNICHTASAQGIVSYKKCDIEAPNVISLSSGVGNNVWTVDSEGLETFECKITNRWGNLVYQFSDPNGGWDGTSNGNIVSEGTYFYIIDAVLENGEVLQKHGFIEVVH